VTIEVSVLHRSAVKEMTDQSSSWRSGWAGCS
jgi:hypothetical protein